MTLSKFVAHHEVWLIFMEQYKYFKAKAARYEEQKEWVLAIKTQAVAKVFLDEATRMQL